MAKGSCADNKQLLRSSVGQMTVAPDTLEVEITYKVSGAIGEINGSGIVSYCELSTASDSTCRG